MTDSRDSIVLRCPRCRHVVATMPPARTVASDHLVCPGCGARVYPPHPQAPVGTLLRRAAGFVGRIRRGH